MTRKKTEKTLPEPVPMDATITEAKVGTAATNTKRACWAIKTLVAEVTELFPETAVEYSNYDGRNTALAVTFTFTSLDEPDLSDFKTLLLALPIEEHKRVLSVTTLDASVTVTMYASARTQDIREPFALAGAWMILSADEDTADEPAWDFDNPDAVNVLGGSL